MPTEIELWGCFNAGELEHILGQETDGTSDDARNYRVCTAVSDHFKPELKKNMMEGGF